MEHKTFPSIGTKVIDADQGIVEGVITLFGVLDRGNDISFPNSFRKTLSERGSKVKVLDSHKTDSVMRVLGKPLEIREMSRAELPHAIVDQYPEVTGGVYAKTQFLMDTPEGRGAFARIKSGALQEWSYGYDALDVEHATVKNGEGQDVRARLLKTVRLWEYSPVLWGLVPGTTVVSAKGDNGDPDKAVGGADALTPPGTVWHCTCPKCGHEWNSDTKCAESTCPECGHELGGRSAGTGTEGRQIIGGTGVSLASDAGPEEEKPWRAIREGDKWRVYQVDEDGNPTGEPLGEHDTQAEAAAQVRALYANEPEAGKVTWTARYVNDLPDGSFLYVESGGDKDDEGKTTPRSLRHFPYKDADGSIDLPHLRNAIARIPQSNAPGLTDAKKTQLQERARRMLEDAQKADAKIGRVLAARNATRIANALARLIEVLEDAGVDIPGYGETEEEEKSDQPATDAGDDTAPAEAATDDAAPEQAATDEEETDEQAGPPDGTPTSEELLKLIGVEQDEIAILLEV